VNRFRLETEQSKASAASGYQTAQPFGFTRTTGSEAWLDRIAFHSFLLLCM